MEALRTLVADLPADLDAAVCIVLHIPPSGKSLLAPILARMTPLETVLAEHGAPLRPGVIYVAPADRHLLIRHDVVELSRGPRENGVRPAADPMFRSLAAAWGANGVAVVLSGSLDDGAAGAAAVVEAGGRLLVQEPSDALVPGMPSSAIAVTRPEAVLPIDEIGAALGRLATPTGGPGPRRIGRPASRVASGFTCPECAGALWELREGGLVRYALPGRPRLLRGGDGRGPGRRCRGRAVAGADGARGARRAAGADRRPDAGTRRAPSSASGTARARPASGLPRFAACWRAAARRSRDDDGRGVRGAARVPQAHPRDRLHGYKRPSLQRRFLRRMEAVRCDSFGDYLDYLEVTPEEYGELFETLLINVTEFFRDPAAWEHLREEVLPALLRQGPRRADPRLERRLRERPGGVHDRDGPRRALGADAYRERVKIYATDIDEDALSQARLAIYSAKETETVPEELRERYFERADQRLAFRKDLRRTVIFGRNNLVQDAPISRLDLLICRNTLMYFTAETQGRILRHFHFALDEAGALMLGKSEMMVSHRELFTASDLKHRSSSSSRGRRSAAGRARSPPRGGRRRRRPGGARGRARARSAGPGDRLAHRPAHVRQPGGPRAVSDLARGHRPAVLRAAARPSAGRARARDRAGVARAPARAAGRVAFAPERGDARRLDVIVTPLLSADNVAIGVSVTFEDVTRYAALQSELEGNRRDLELAYEELQSTIDELETTNEELQSANEELQTTNEELQSTNEELETMNEELQSTNEELETINDELRERTGELNQVNDFLEAILTSLGLGVAVLDPQQRVQVWNRHAEELWGVRPDEAVENHFLGLDIGLPAERLAPALRAVLSGASERETRRAGGRQPPRAADRLRGHRASAREPGRDGRRGGPRRDRDDGGPPARRAVTSSLMDDDRDHEATARSALERAQSARERARAAARRAAEAARAADEARSESRRRLHEHEAACTRPPKRRTCAPPAAGRARAP